MPSKHKMKNKKGLMFKNVFFAVIIVGVVIVAVGSLINGWNTAYSSGMVYKLDEFNQISAMSAEANSSSNKITLNDPDPGTDAESSTYRGVYGIISNIYAPFRVVFGDNGMIDSVTEKFGFPDYMRQAVVAMMIIAFTFALVAIIFRLSKGSA